MKTETTRILAGENVTICVYNGKMRLLLNGCFPEMSSHVKERLSEIEQGNRVRVHIYPDGSFSVEKASLIDFDIPEDTIEDMLDTFLTETEKLFELPVGESCTSSAWNAGHSDSEEYDNLLSEEEKQLIA